ncbi:hypothetical protein [Micromonospora sp. DT31]|uniref:hypothetical protein n=1 Tax=Micromonospora sp. DT31 TaxID=3393434 RepID=UPI003CF806C6
MGTTDPGSAREEAERLVATLLATAKLAAAPGSGPWGPLGGILSGVLGHTPPGSGHRTPAPSPEARFATGSAECCVCPVCRGIAAVRDPSPEFAERLATGAGDLADGVASLLRAFTPAEPATPAGGTDTAPEGSGDRVWREATRTGHDSQPASEPDVWSAATRGEGTAGPGPASDAPTVSGPPTGAPVVPASRAAGEAGADAPGDEA